MSYRILFVVPEVAPFSKTGGLADVAASLPNALCGLGHKITIVTPLYRMVSERYNPIETDISVSIHIKGMDIEGRFLKGLINDDIEVYFLKRDEFFDRRYLYSTPDGDYFDNAERFIFFSRCIIESLKGGMTTPDIIHCHDWHTGLIPLYIKELREKEGLFLNTAVVFTIHNVAYQGIFPPCVFSDTGLSKDLSAYKGLEFWGRVNFMKSGITYADIITTVSNRYSKEIQTEEYGYGLESVLKERADDLYGILNGVDYTEWDPSKDNLIAARYSIDDLSGKKACKEDLLREYGMDIPIDTPLIGIISRLSEQKGFDILLKAMKRLMDMDLGIVILGYGDRSYQEALKELSNRYPKRLGIRITFDNTLAHKIEAGSDMFLMPSRYEPCGLNQIYSLRYGTIPIVRATGGLDDTIKDYNPKTGTGNGFKFKDYSADALADKVGEAIEVFKDRAQWERLMKNAMREDLSWKRSARAYEELYKNTLQKTDRFR